MIYKVILTASAAILIALLLLNSGSHSLDNLQSEKTQYTLSQIAYSLTNQQMLGQQRITGDGFTFQMITVLNSSLHEAYSKYGMDYIQHTAYISSNLRKLIEGKWNVIIIPQLNITKNLLDEIGYTAYTSGNIYALWYGVCSYDKNIAYFLTFLSTSTEMLPMYVNTQTTFIEKLPAGYTSIIRGINKDVSLTKHNTTANYNTEVSNKLRNFANEKWCVLTFSYFENKQYPQAYGLLSSSSSYGVFSGQFTTKAGLRLNQLLYKIEL